MQTFSGDGVRLQSGGIDIIFEPKEGAIPARTKTNIFIKSKRPFETDELKDIADRVIAGPGEYDVKGIEMWGSPDWSYLLRAENIYIGFLGSEEGNELIAKAEVIFLKNKAKMAAFSKQFEAKVIIVLDDKADQVEKELGLKAESLEKITLKKKDLASEVKLYILK